MKSQFIGDTVFFFYLLFIIIIIIIIIIIAVLLLLIFLLVHICNAVVKTLIRRCILRRPSNFLSCPFYVTQ